MADLTIKGYSIDDLTKAATAATIAAYVLGFVVLSYHFASYGFSPLSPFRARILETGICTLICVAIPITMGLAAAHIPARDTPFPIAIAMRILLVPCVAFFVDLPGFVRDMPSGPSFTTTIRGHTFGHGVIAALCIGLVVLATLFVWILSRLLNWIWHNYHQRALASFMILVPLSACATVLGLSVHDVPRKRFFAWCVLVAAAVCAMAWNSAGIPKKLAELIDGAKANQKEVRDILHTLDPDGWPRSDEEPDKQGLLERAVRLYEQNKQQLNELQSETSTLRLWNSLRFIAIPIAFSYIMLAVAAYTYWIYPSLPSRIGGGEIMPATLYFTPMGSIPRTIHAGLLDQSDEGFFLLLPGQQKGTFVPKDDHCSNRNVPVVQPPL